MKTKKFNKKLVLNKKTIADLNHLQMNDVRAGEDTDGCTQTCPRQCSEPPEACLTWPVLECNSIKTCFTWNCQTLWTCRPTGCAV